MATSPAPHSEIKDHIRLNTVNYGLNAQHVVLPDADRDAFQKSFSSLDARYQPQTLEELELVQTLHETWWRLDRAIVNERNLHLLTEQQQLENIDALFGEQEEPARRSLAQAAGIQANMRLFDQLSRHIARLHRLIDQTRRALEFRIAQRRQAEQLAALEKVTEQSQPAPAAAGRATPEMPHFTGPMKDIKRKQWLKQQAKLNQRSMAS